MRLSDYIAKFLISKEIERIYMVTGRGALFLTDAVAKEKNLRAICMHHEQSAAFAAIAEAELTGKPAVCMVSTGCASTNTITGVLSAWQDGIPAIFISGQNVLKETTRHTGSSIRTYGQQEADIISLIHPITKYSVMIEEPSSIKEELEKAYQLAMEGRKGPVWLDIPLDLQSSTIIEDDLDSFKAVSETKIASDDGIKEVVDALNKSDRPVFLVGSGVKSCRAEAKLIRLVEKYKIPLSYTSSGADIYGSFNPLSIGSVGTMGCSRSGNFAVQNSDLLISLGSRLTNLNTGPDFCKFARDAKIICVDLDEKEHDKEGIDYDLFIESDINSFLDKLNTYDLKVTNKFWLEKCYRWKEIFSIENAFKSNEKIDLYDFSQSLSESMNDKSCFVCDSGLIDVIMPTTIQFKKGQRCLHPVSQGAMGYALPAAVGASLTWEGDVVAVIGDGSIMMNLQELQTIVHHQLPIKIFIINNDAYSIIRRRQEQLFRRRTIGTDDSNGVSCPDYEKVAAAFGIDYCFIDTPQKMKQDLPEILKTSGSIICELVSKEDQSYVELHQARNQEKKFVRRPIEDQSPFLPRELFLSEMLIDPIDQ